MKMHIKSTRDNIPLSDPLEIYKRIEIGKARNDETYSIYLGLNKKDADQLTAYAADKNDKALQQNTSDYERFVEKGYGNWYSKGRFPFILINDATKELAAIIWVGPKQLPKGKFLKPLAQKNPCFYTFAIRAFGKYRGKGLVTPFLNFISKVIEDGIEDSIVWLIVEKANEPAKGLYKKFGFEKVEYEFEDDSLQRKKEIMLLEKLSFRSGNMSRLFLLDFDETLFDTTKLKKDLQDFFLEKYSLNFKENYEDFKNAHGAYDYYAHVKSSGTKKSTNELQQEFLDYFRVKEYEYPDVKSFVERHADDKLVIVTLGFDNFQNMKIDITPNVSSLDRMTMEEDKPKFIKDKLTRVGGIFESVIFVDDRPTFLLQEEIPGFKQYRIRRKGSKYFDMETPENATEIESLDEL